MADSSRVMTSSEGREFDARALDEATLSATTGDGACEVCGRERLDTLWSQSTYAACTAVGRTFLYYDVDVLREAGYDSPEDPALDGLGLIPDWGDIEKTRERLEGRKVGPFGCEGEALDWAEEFEEVHPELRWSSMGREDG